MEKDEQERRPGRWNRDEGMKVANLLGEKSLIKASTFEGRAKLKVISVVMEKTRTASFSSVFNSLFILWVLLSIVN